MSRTSSYEFLSAGPEAFRVLTAGLTLVGEYSFGSLTFKALERRADGVFEPVGHDGPVYLVEFQAQPVAHAWYNLLTKMGLYGETHPLADVRAILIFLDERDDPGLPRGIGNADHPFKAVYLDRFLPDWLEREPDNPFVAVFAPLVLKRDEDLWALPRACGGPFRTPRCRSPSAIACLRSWHFGSSSVFVPTPRRRFGPCCNT
ncbi:DUF2887 domain-containing protein [Candidatus Thiodictyon syntrophicum]|uniref:DUF2887 domain-containing protein n=1 Tax=Candidatus Thiodictyon syntrophicum TaxID=1166950 RepID=UPI003001F4D4